MPKYKLEFNIPEEKDEFELASHGSDIWGALWDISQEMRNYLKHDSMYFESPQEAVEYFRKRINEEINDIGIEF